MFDNLLDEIMVNTTVVFDHISKIGLLFYMTGSMAISEDDVYYIDAAQEAVPVFTALVVLEFIYDLFTGKDFCSAGDSLTSLAAGGAYSVIKLMSRSTTFSMYSWVYDNYSLVQLPWSSPLTWFVAFITADFVYYWFHRAAHEVNIFWSFHQMHHSSEYYNFSTALRQGVFQIVIHSFFDLPAALICPPKPYYTYMMLNLTYQFWLHNRHIRRLGFLEWIFNTPSYHRVHHGRNPYCIDKNYAGTLIIWDRLFNTFQEEKDDEPVAYGLVTNVNSFDYIYCQFAYMKYAFWDKPRSMANWKDRLKAMFYGPGWQPGKPRMGDINDVPQISYPVKPYKSTVTVWMLTYLIFNTSIFVYVYDQFMNTYEQLTYLTTTFYIVLMFSTGYIFALLVDNTKWYARHLEIIRCASFHYYLWRTSDSMGVLVNLLANALFYINLTFWSWQIVSTLLVVKCEWHHTSTKLSKSSSIYRKKCTN